MAARRPRKKQRAQARKRGTTPRTPEAAAKGKGGKRGTAAPRRPARRVAARPSRPRAVPAPEPVMESLEALEAPGARRDTGPALSGGDLDADWQRAQDTGEEAVGGSVATPDQDVVDEIGRALGVEQGADSEVWTSQDILGRRDRRYWRIERKAAEEDDA